MKKNELFKQWHKLWVMLNDDMPFEMEQYLSIWDGIAMSYGYFLDVSNNDEFAEDINSVANYNSCYKFVEVCEKYFLND